MQRFLFLKSAASNFSHKLPNTSNSSLVQLSQPHRIFTTSTNPCLPNALPKFSHLSPPPSSSDFSRRVFGFLSHPLLPNQLMSKLPGSTFAISIKGLTDRKFRLLGVRFSRGFSGFNSSFANNGRFRRSWLDQLSTDNVVFGLIIANLAVFLAWHILDQRFMSRNFMISLDNVKSGRIHTILTSAFSHMDMNHIISNMIGLYFFGTSIGRTLGPKYLLKLYIAGAIGGSVFYLVHHSFLALQAKGNGMWAKDPSRSPALGASGAVNAILLLSILLNPRATLYFDFIIPVPAALLGIFLIGKDVLAMLEKDSRISGSAHLGGAAVAAIAYARIRKGRF